MRRRAARNQSRAPGGVRGSSMNGVMPESAAGGAGLLSDEIILYRYGHWQGGLSV